MNKMTKKYGLIVVMMLSLHKVLINANSCIESFADEYKQGLIECPKINPWADIFCEHAIQFYQPIIDSLKATPTRNK